MGRIDFTKLDTYRRVFDGFLQIKGVVDGYTNLPITASDGDIYKDKISGRLYSKSGEKWLVSGMTEDDIKLFSPEVYVKLSDVTTPKTNVLYLIGPSKNSFIFSFPSPRFGVAVTPYTYFACISLSTSIALSEAAW